MIGRIGDRGGLAPGATAALERAGFAAGHVQVQSDFRKSVTAQVTTDVQIHTGRVGGAAVTTTAGVTIHALPQLELATELGLTYTSREPRYVGNIGSDYVFGRQLAKRRQRRSAGQLHFYAAVVVADVRPAVSGFGSL